MAQQQKVVGWLRTQGLVVFCLLLVAAVSAFGQGSTGTILGVVKDATGGTVAGANVTVTNVDTRLSRSLMTGEDGAYRFPELPVGNYEVQVVKDGFQTYDRKGVTLEIAQQAVIEATLQVGSTGQTVTVTEEAPLVNTTSATLGGTVDEQKVEDLPLNGRNFVDLTLLQPGVTQTSITTGPYGMGGTMYSSNGATLRSNMTTLDGANMTSLMGLSSTSAIFTTLGIDGIKEYKVVTNMFSAEYGLATGSQSILVSKSGTNQWHGDGFEYLRNDALDANNYFNRVDYTNARGNACDANGDKLLAYPCKRIPPYKRNNFGGSFGGAIRKDKLFFYGVYEGLRERLSPPTTATTFPIGCFVDQNNVLHSTIQSTINNNPATNPYDTIISGVKTACTGANPGIINVGGGPGLAQNQILQLANLFPQPLPGLGGVLPGYVPGTGITQPVNSFNYQFPFTQPSAENYEQLRLDQNIGANDSAFLRYTVDRSSQNPNGSWPQWYDNNRSLSAIGTLSETHIVSPTVVNTARLSFSRTDLALGLQTFTGLGGTGTTPNPGGVLIPGREDSTGIGPGSGTSAITSYGPCCQSSSNTNGDIAQNIWQISDDVFWTKGKHAFKFGTQINHYTGLFRVNFTYEGSLSYPNLDSFFQDEWSAASSPLIGGGGAPIPSYITNGTDGFGNFSPQDRKYWWNTLGFYIQDDYRILPRVTLNLGLRYEFNTLPQAPSGLSYTVLNPGQQVPCTIPAGSFGCTGPANGQGTPGGLWSVNNSLHDLSPRIGFAWDVFGDGKTSLRGGGAIMYDTADFGTSIAGNATGDPSLSALEDMAVTYPKGYTGAAPIPLSIAGLNVPQCTGAFQFTPTCPTNSFQNLGSFPCQNVNGVPNTSPVFLNYGFTCPSGMKATVALETRVADHNMKQPTMGEWNLTVDRQLPFGMNLSVSYVGTKGWHVMQTTESNPTMATGIGANGLPFYCSTSTTAAVEAAGSATCVTNSLNNRPNPNLGTVQFYTAGGDSYYEGLQTSLNKRLTNGLSLQLSYSYAKAIDDGEKANSDGGSGSLSGQTICSGVLAVENGVTNYSNPATGTATGATQVPCSLNIDRGPTFFDIRHNLRVNVIYHIPDIKSDHFYAKPLHGWWLADITSYQTGFPINIVSGSGANERSMTSNTNASGGRPNLDPSYNPSTVVTGDPNGWFNTTMFDLQPPGTFGNVARNSIRGPHLSNSNISINKDTKVKWLGEAGLIQFRVEMFNAFNHPSFNAPGGSIGWSAGTTGVGQVPGGQFQDARFAGSPTTGPKASGNSGVITSLAGVGNREIQIDAKIVF